MYKFLSKALGICGYIVQYGCITHCTFEYLGDFVVVSNLFRCRRLLYIIVQQSCTTYLPLRSALAPRWNRP